MKDLYSKLFSAFHDFGWHCASEVVMTAGLSEVNAPILRLPILLRLVLPGCIIDKLLHVH